MIDRVVPFESFRAEIEAATLTPASKKKSNAGRKPIDVIVMGTSNNDDFVVGSPAAVA